MIEFLTSDPAIFLATGLALALTTVTILRDTRAQRALEAEDVVLAVAMPVAEVREPDPMELAA